MRSNSVQEKSFAFALNIIQLYKKLAEQLEYVISQQLLRAGTSIGANIEEAQAAQSRKDFLSKMAIAAKEARETRYWLRLLEESQLVSIDVSAELAAVNELVRMLTAIVKTTATS
ncbi:MAG TPA: four helix bundle protein [Roseiflexaceae bacterium]|nr:four helix bundle protein [Roseiflexaceae bacterium]